MERIANLQDEVLLPPPTESTTATSSKILVYFIPGNPGCIEYYRDFLSHLHENLPLSQKQITTIYGASHDGFEMHSINLPTTSHGHNPPFSLQEVINGTQRKITAQATAVQADQVVLMGHSVGSYILLEVLTWYQQQQSSLPFKVIAGMCLFPTIVDIALSSKGRVMSRLLPLPGVPALAQLLARSLSFVPLWLWDWPGLLTPGEKTAEYKAVTEGLVRSVHGAKQTVFLARDEMISIRVDKWHPANVWGVAKDSNADIRDDEGEAQPLLGKVDVVREDLARTKLFFYWGEADYWVNDATRDNLIAKRARRQSDAETKHWPEMVVDRHRIDHCFSLNAEHSRLVAMQVAQWMGGLQTTS